MGYRIVYGEDPFVKKSKSHLRAWTAGFALAFVILVRTFWPQGTAVLAQVLLPRSNGIEQLTAQIRAGEPVGDVVTAFCRELVEEALGEAG